MTRSRKLRFLTVISVVIMVGLSACGDDDESTEAPATTSQPASKAGVFASADGTDIPVYPGSQATGPAKETGDTVTQTFSVSANPPEISQFYTDQLRDWVPVEAISPGPNPTDPYRATWDHGSDRLQLLVDRPPREAGDKPLIRYTLTLNP